MITPRFSLRQDDSHVYVSIKAPHFKTADLELMVDKDVFLFSLPPYYLRLRLPHEVEDTEDSPAKADLNSSEGTIEVSLPKATPGQFFEDLDMVSKLLARKSELESAKPKSKPLIEEMGPSTRKEDLLNFNPDGTIDWEIEQDINGTQQLLGQSYGFDNGYSELMGVSALNGNDINELETPETATPEERTSMRKDQEDQKFDPEYYLCDLFDNPMITELLNYSPDYNDTRLNDEEQARLVQLKHKSYLLSQPKQTYVAILSFLFGVCYDLRTNMGESTVESAWTIGKLCPQLACLDSSFTSIKDLVVSCTKRSLAFPLYRHWGLTEAVWNDVYQYLLVGKPALLKMFIHLVAVFDKDLYGVYNHVWLYDMTIWIQSANELAIKSLAHELKHVQLSRADLDWDLETIESEAQQQFEQEINP